MRETRQSGSEGGAAFIAPSLPLSLGTGLRLASPLYFLSPPSGAFSSDTSTAVSGFFPE
jgi:hypothetical protein